MVYSEILETILIVLFIHYVVFIAFLFIGVFRLKRKSFNNNLKASVIVPFRNEENKIRQCLLSLFEQDFDKERYEIILVDDNSEDNGIEKIKDLLAQNNVRLIRIENGAGKKKAIEKGIEIARNEIIVTTDADCYHSKKWLRSLIESFDENTGFVAGKIVYTNTKNFFELIQKIEFASLVSIGAAFIGNKIPLLANGASCAYRKDLFYKVGGFKDNLVLASGDEEFLMQKIRFDTDYKIRFCVLDNSTTFTEPVHSPVKFINQRKRWVSKVLFYRNKMLIPVLVLLYLFYLVFLFSIFLALLSTSFANTIFQIFLIKIFIDMIFMLNGFRLLEFKFGDILKMILVFPIAEIFHLFYISIVPILSYITGFDWKGRNYKR